MTSELDVAFGSLDGTALKGTLTVPERTAVGAAVLVHGAGVTRHEGGFFTRLAAGLAHEGVQCLRFDLRAHGASGGRAEEVTIAGVANDIRAASDHLRTEAGVDRPVHVIAASFSGGAAALHAAHRPQDVDRLVLLNPVWTTGSGTSPAARTSTPTTSPRPPPGTWTSAATRRSPRGSWAGPCTTRCSTSTRTSTCAR